MCACRLGLNTFSMQLNEMTPGLEAKLAPTDTRWRQDMRALEKGDYAQASSASTISAPRVHKERTD